jgi:hypothetical protein
MACLAEKAILYSEHEKEKIRTIEKPVFGTEFAAYKNNGHYLTIKSLSTMPDCIWTMTFAKALFSATV